MICVHFCGALEFLRIGAGKRVVTAALCVACPDCAPDGNIDCVESLASSERDSLLMKVLRQQHDLVHVSTYEGAKEYLSMVRPMIEVGKGSLGIVAPLPYRH